MINEETMAAALRVDQYSARRAMLAVRTETPDDVVTSAKLPDHAKEAPASANDPRDTTGT